MGTNEGDKPRRILFLTPQLPYPPEQGTAIRNYNLIREVASRHKVALLSFAHSMRPLSSVNPLRQICSPLCAVPFPIRSTRDRLRTLLTTRAPDMAHRLRSAEFASSLRKLLTEESFDLVQVEGIELAPYIPLMRQWLGERCPSIVFDDHNAEYLLQRRACKADLARARRWPAALYSWIQWHRLMRFERLICRNSEGVVVVSDADARALRQLAPELQPLVIPNGVDVERYHPQLPDSLPLHHPSIVFTGKMDFRPNIDAVLWFFRHVWPLIAVALPNVHLYIVGKSPHVSLLPMGRDPRVAVTGYVEDILPYFGGADVYVVPLRVGGGTRLKVLEALSAGLPLVSTSLGVEGISLISGTHALLADTPQGFCRAVCSLLRDPQRGQALGVAARRFVLEHYDWRQIVPRIEPLYRSV